MSLPAVKVPQSSSWAALQHLGLSLLVIWCVPASPHTLQPHRGSGRPSWGMPGCQEGCQAAALGCSVPGGDTGQEGPGDRDLAPAL